MTPDGSGLLPFETESGATLLAETPIDVPALPELAGWDDLSSHCENRLAQMRVWRNSWWQHWALLAEYILPRRYHWLITPNTTSRGNMLNTRIVDPTGTQAVRVCVSGLMSGLTSPSRPWMKLKPIIPEGVKIDRDGQLWLDEVEMRLYAAMAGSNFYDSMSQMFEDLVVFGTSPVIIYEDSRDIFRCYNPCAGEYFLAVSPALRVESFYREFVLTVAQIVEMFGLENCGDDIQGLWQTKGGSIDQERIVAHAIEPNFDVATQKGEKPALKAEFPWREVYWLRGAAGINPLALRGFWEAPFIAPRWALTSNDPYGRSPGMDTLPDIMQLQIETRRKAEAIEKQVRPPLLASIELKNEPSSSLPGSITYVAGLDASKGMRPTYTVEPDIRAMMEDLKEIQVRVRSGFFNDLFLMLEQAPMSDRMTAYEVAKRMEEKLQVLGPVIERSQNEGLSPAIKRMFSIMQRKGLLPPLPDSLKGIKLAIDYISMLALAQKATATTSIERTWAFAGQIASVRPGVLDNLDEDTSIREYGDLMTLPHKIFFSEEQVAQRRDMQAKAQQAQQMQHEAMTAGAAAVEGAKSLGDTDVGGGQNALQMILGNPAGPPQ